MRKPAPKPALFGFIAVAFALLVATVVFGPSLTPEDDRHEKYAGTLWPGRPFERQPAVMFRDRNHPLTWHVCTAQACGHYYEVQGEKFGPEGAK